MPTLLHRLNRWAIDNPDVPAQTYFKDGKWVEISSREFRNRVYYLALFLESQGVKKDDIGCILSTNRPEWVHTELALCLLQAKSAGLYPNSTQQDIQFILQDTRAKVLAVQNLEFFKKTQFETTNLPQSIKLVLCFSDQDCNEKAMAGAVSYTHAIEQGRKIAESNGQKKIDDFLAHLNPKVGSFLIYTSGTTGSPKGAVLSQDNLAFTSDLASNYWMLPISEGILFSFLPLCHIAEKLQCEGVGISQRFNVYFCTKFESLLQEIVEVQPTLLLCVPRLWEKMMEGVLTKVRRSSGMQKILATWALSQGEKLAQAKFNPSNNKKLGILDKAQWKIADTLVLRKIRHALGLSRAHTLASGAAPLPAHVSKWFRFLNLEILEDFGQTESTGVICMTQRNVECAGTVGKPVPGIEFKLAGDGEILTRGRHVFSGYYNDLRATKMVLSEDGWLATGDLGETTSAGMIRIRGRKKEIMKTSGGKMIAPLAIEESLKRSTMVSQACLVGDGKKYVSALLTLTEDQLDQLRKAKGPLHEDFIEDPAVLTEIRRHISSVNENLASFEQVKKFTVLSKEFSVLEGEMTPTLKIKRSVIETKYRVLIDKMYPEISADS